jgi:hypothetical protein
LQIVDILFWSVTHVPIIFRLHVVFPSRRQFCRWTYPAKFAFVTFFIGIAITICLGVTTWLFPEAGKNIGDRLRSDPQETITVPGDNAIERALNRAKIEGVNATEPSSEFAVAIPFALPTLAADARDNNFSGNTVAFSNASPLRSTDQDLVFAPGKCRFLGSVRWTGEPALAGEAEITGLSCVMDNGDYYGFGKADGSAIGFVAPADEPGSKELALVEEGKYVTLPRDGKYLVRFFSPLRDIPLKGKSPASW